MSNVGKMSQVLNAYPVGSIYMSVNSTNPGELFGGTWEQIQGRFLLGQGSGYSAGAIGGEANHALSDNEMPSHRHWITSATYDDGNGSGTGGNSQYYGLWADAGGYSADDSWGTMDDIPRGLVAMAQGKLIEMSLRTIICHLILSYIFGSGRLNH